MVGLFHCQFILIGRLCELVKRTLVMKIKILGAAFMGALLVSTAACNTVKGLGEDVKSVGRAGEKAID